MKRYEIVKISFEVNHPVIANACYDLGQTHFNSKKYDAAFEWLNNALEIQEKSLGEESKEAVDSWIFIGAVYHEKSDFPTALEYFTSVLDIRKRSHGENSMETAIACLNVGKTYLALEKYDNALQIYQYAETIMHRNPFSAGYYLLDVYERIAEVYAEQKKYVESIEWNHKALSLCESWLGSDNDQAVEIRDRIKRLVKENPN